MAVIIYEVLRKPIDQRIIDAACIYWDVERSYFNQVGQKTTLVYRRSILYYLLRTNTQLSYESIAELFGLCSHQPVIRSIEIVEARQRIYQQVFNDLGEIKKLADTLDAKFISCAIELHNNQPKLM